MKLLILTQKVDKEDPILGFFHSWLLEFSKKFEKVSVICLEKGTFNLPNNVKVYSLGKSAQGGSALGGDFKNKIKYVKNFFNLILGLHKDYDAVFVHMNQEYVLLGGFIWKILRKKVYLWRNHQYGNFLTRITVWFSNKVFCTSKFAFVAKYKKTQIMPVGINTEVFKSEISDSKSETKNKILFLSRMSPIKNPNLLVEALNILNKKNIDFVCDFYGNALPKDQNYFDSLKGKAKKFGLSKKINFYNSVPNYDTTKIYVEHNIFVNLTPSGSFDKTILEAAACGCLPVILNKTLRGDIEDKLLIKEISPESVAETLNYWIGADLKTKEKIGKDLIKYVESNHSLNILAENLKKEIK